MRLSPADAAAVAAELDLDIETVPICLACLTFVSFPLDLGNEREAVRAIRELAPDFWEEGLETPTREALEQARARGVERAAEAVRDVERLGARSEVVRAVVRRLAEEQLEQMRNRWGAADHERRD
jgi:hypothetical protein